MAGTPKGMPVTEHVILSRIYEIRGFKVMLDEDLAMHYEVPTKRLNEQVKRNKERFPEDFIFPLTPKEFEFLKSQNATSSWGGRRTAPFAFTEHGVLMLSSVLNSDRAISVNIQIMRIYTRMREMVLTNKEIMLQLEKMEKKVNGHDRELKVVFECLKKLVHTPDPPRKRIGFRRSDEKD